MSDAPHTTYPEFHTPAFLLGHVEDTLGFYRKNAFDPAGGFFHCFMDDGTVYDTAHRHLVSSCRFVFNFAMSAARTGNAEDKARAVHGLAFLEKAHRLDNGAYAWELRDGVVSDTTIMGYGHAFVLLAAAAALKADIAEGRAVLDHVWALLEDRFWEPEYSAYVDEFTGDFTTPDPYRGQNVNMHMCEACIAAWQATGEDKFLQRAQVLARGFAFDRANLTETGMVWEHYTSTWTPDFEFNADKPDDLFRPWGFQPGHQVEWARLLLILDGIAPQDWYLERAETLYNKGLKGGRDPEFGGIYYGVAPDGTACAPTKYYWVQSETIATAWRLYQRTGKPAYRADFDATWRYAWDNFVDHDYGAWFRVLTREGKKLSAEKSPPGKTDYHTVGVVWDVLDNLA
jgi:mannose/cellobiose epimerase-like protein (N-acyl-D-glucosamine 2-epimerase family)